MSLGDNARAASSEISISASNPAARSSTTGEGADHGGWWRKSLGSLFEIVSNLEAPRLAKWRHPQASGVGAASPRVIASRDNRKRLNNDIEEASTAIIIGVKWRR